MRSSFPSTKRISMNPSSRPIASDRTIRLREGLRWSIENHTIKARIDPRVLGPCWDALARVIT